MIHFDLHSYSVENSRLTTDPVENYFGHLKNNMLNKRKKLLPSEFVAPNYNRLKSIFFQFHNDCIRNEKLSDYNENKFEEIWLDSKSKKHSRKKGYYFQNNAKDLFGLDEISLTNESKTNENFLQAFETNQIEKRKAKLIDLSEICTELTMMKDIYFRIENQGYETIQSTLLNEKTTIERVIKKIRDLNIEILYQTEKCDTRFDNTIKINKLDDFKAIHVSGDGNCFYYSIAKLIFGDTKYYFIIKLISNYAIYINQTCFERLLTSEKYGIRFEDFVANSFRKKEWSNQLNTLATSFALDRPIQTFSLKKKVNIPDIKVFSHSRSLEKKALMIGFDTNHFVPLVAIKKEYKKVNLENIYYQSLLKDMEIF